MSSFLMAVFHKFYLVHYWILCPIAYCPSAVQDAVIFKYFSLPWNFHQSCLFCHLFMLFMTLCKKLVTNFDTSCASIIFNQHGCCYCLLRPAKARIFMMQLNILFIVYFLKTRVTITGINWTTFHAELGPNSMQYYFLKNLWMRRMTLNEDS